MYACARLSLVRSVHNRKRRCLFEYFVAVFHRNPHYSQPCRLLAHTVFVLLLSPLLASSLSHNPLALVTHKSPKQKRTNDRVPSHGLVRPPVPAQTHISHVVNLHPVVVHQRTMAGPGHRAATHTHHTTHNVRPARRKRRRHLHKHTILPSHCSRDKKLRGSPCLS